MSDPSSPPASLGRASGHKVGVDRQDNEQLAKGQTADALRPPYSPSTLEVPARIRNAPSDAAANEPSPDANVRLGLPRSQSHRSLPSQDSSSSSTSPYSSLQYAPRQRSNHAYRASQASFQSHGSLWKQQQQHHNSSTSDTASNDPTSPSLVAAFPTLTASASSPVLSTMAIEGVPNTTEQQKTSAAQVSAAEKLAKQQLRADAEDLGLRVGSVGWAILDRIQSATEGEWRELGEMLSRGEATLLLPTSPLKTPEVTLSHAYNHTIFSTGSIVSSDLVASSIKGKERETPNLVTFKGLREELVDASEQRESMLIFKSLCLIFLGVV